MLNFRQLRKKPPKGNFLLGGFSDDSMISNCAHPILQKRNTAGFIFPVDNRCALTSVSTRYRNIVNWTTNRKSSFRITVFS